MQRVLVIVSDNSGGLQSRFFYLYSKVLADIIIVASVLQFVAVAHCLVCFCVRHFRESVNVSFSQFPSKSVFKFYDHTATMSSTGEKAPAQSGGSRRSKKNVEPVVKNEMRTWDNVAACFLSERLTEVIPGGTVTGWVLDGTGADDETQFNISLSGPRAANVYNYHAILPGQKAVSYFGSMEAFYKKLRSVHATLPKTLIIDCVSIVWTRMKKDVTIHTNYNLRRVFEVVKCKAQKSDDPAFCAVCRSLISDMTNAFDSVDPASAPPVKPRSRAPKKPVIDDGALPICEAPADSSVAASAPMRSSGSNKRSNAPPPKPAARDTDEDEILEVDDEPEPEPERCEVVKKRKRSGNGNTASVSARQTKGKKKEPVVDSQKDEIKSDVTTPASKKAKVVSHDGSTRAVAVAPAPAIDMDKLSLLIEKAVGGCVDRLQERLMKRVADSMDVMMTNIIQQVRRLPSDEEDDPDKLEIDDGRPVSPCALERAPPSAGVSSSGRPLRRAAPRKMKDVKYTECVEGTVDDLNKVYQSDLDEEAAQQEDDSESDYDEAKDGFVQDSEDDQSEGDPEDDDMDGDNNEEEEEEDDDMEDDAADETHPLLARAHKIHEDVRGHRSFKDEASENDMTPESSLEDKAYNDENDTMAVAPPSAPAAKSQEPSREEKKSANRPPPKTHNSHVVVHAPQVTTKPAPPVTTTSVKMPSQAPPSAPTPTPAPTPALTARKAVERAALYAKPPPIPVSKQVPTVFNNKQVPSLVSHKNVQTKQPLPLPAPVSVPKKTCDDFINSIGEDDDMDAIPL